MDNFVCYNPTKVVFGKGTIKELANLAPQSKILVIYGGGSIKKNGVYTQVMEALKGRDVFEFSGIEANPHYETCMECVKYIKEKQISFLLAVGGGSVIDATKFIASAVYFNGTDPWDILEKRGSNITKTMPFASVLTLPATGSEMDRAAVITKWETKEKRDMASDLCFPVFSILDPETTYTLPKRQITNGIVDSFTHVMEQYLTYPVRNQIADRFAESILISLIEEADNVEKDPQDYDTRANLMWCATLALNGLIACGVPQDWSTHMIGHELTALHGLDHGVTLSIVLPGTMNVMRDEKGDKILQYGKRVFGITHGTRDERISQTIKKTQEFFHKIGSPIYLSEVGLTRDCIEPIVKRMQDRGWCLGERGTITPEKVRAILLDRLQK